MYNIKITPHNAYSVGALFFKNEFQALDGVWLYMEGLFQFRNNSDSFDGESDNCKASVRDSALRLCKECESGTVPHISPIFPQLLRFQSVVQVTQDNTAQKKRKGGPYIQNSDLLSRCS
jgi:hypothetical protein